MTNREMLLNALQDKNDDWGQTQSDLTYHIACPYSDDKGHPRDDYQYPWNDLDVCWPCIMEWLDKEVSE